MTGPQVVGLDLADGRRLWGHPFQIQYDESISTPAVGEGLLHIGGEEIDLQRPGGQPPRQHDDDEGKAGDRQPDDLGQDLQRPHPERFTLA